MENYKIIEGIKSYSPELAYESTDYPHEHFDRLFTLESNHFWFRSRNRIISILFHKFYKNYNNEIRYLEIGCGTGYVLSEIVKDRKLIAIGAELHIQGLKYAKKRLPNIEFIQMDATSIPFENTFDAIGAFDVIEHIEEDTKVIQCVNKALKKNGLFFISVPQHMWLWSSQDDAAFHKRRYSRKELASKLKENGFEIVFTTSFMFSLLPIMFLSRLRYKKNDLDIKSNKEYDFL